LQKKIPAYMAGIFVYGLLFVSDYLGGLSLIKIGVEGVEVLAV